MSENDGRHYFAGLFDDELIAEDSEGTRQFPAGYRLIVQNTFLLLVKSNEVGNNPVIYAACYCKDGLDELLRRFYAAHDGDSTKKGNRNE